MTENEILFQGKKYISSKRASEISGYAKDYIGQLCRAGELKCQRVGRGWFVSVDDLLLHLKKSPRKNKKSLHKEIIQISSKRSRLLSLFYSFFLTYKFKSLLIKIVRLSGNYIKGWFEPPVSPKFGFAKHKDFFLFVFGLIFLLVATLGLPFYGKTINTIGDSFSSFPISASKETTAAINKISQIDLFDIKDSISSSISNLTVSIVKNTLKSIEEVKGGLKMFSQNFKEIVWEIFSPPQADKGTLSYADKTKIKETESKEGLVVIPSSGDESDDEKIKQRIKETFSDEVTVSPDATGISGIIKPVFKYTEGDNYLYILVPIRE